MKVIKDFGRIVVMPSPGEIVPSDSVITRTTEMGFLQSFIEGPYPSGLNPIEVIRIFINRVTDRLVPVTVKNTGYMTYVFVVADTLEIPLDMFRIGGRTVSEVAQNLEQCENRIREWLPDYLAANPDFEIAEV